MTKNIGILDYAKLTQAQPAAASAESEIPTHGADLDARILELASTGLKPRDISSMLGIHPMIVVRVLAEREAPHA